jgi:hypothetical protein
LLLLLAMFGMVVFMVRFPPIITTALARWAAAVAARFVTVIVAAAIPVRICHHRHTFDWFSRVVAVHDQFTRPRFPLLGAVLNHHRQGRS